MQLGRYSPPKEVSPTQAGNMGGGKGKIPAVSMGVDSNSAYNVYAKEKKASSSSELKLQSLEVPQVVGYRESWRDAAYLRSLIKRYHMQPNFRNLLDCHHSPIGGDGELHKSKVTVGSYVPEHVCGNPHVCPICAPRIAAKRGEYIKNAVHSIVSSGAFVYLLTLTFSHHANESIRNTIHDMADCKNRLFADRQVKRLLNGCGSLGRVTTFEFRYGSNGVHPHYHILLVTRSPLPLQSNDAENEMDYAAQSAESILKDAWKRVCSLNSRTCSEANGLDVELATTAGVADYCTKISHEMVSSQIKQGRAGASFSFLQMLRYCRIQYNQGDREGLESMERVLIDLMLGSKGVRSVCISHKLYTEFGLQPMAPDEELADESAEAEAEAVRTFNYDLAQAKGVLEANGRAVIRYCPIEDTISMFEDAGVPMFGKPPYLPDYMSVKDDDVPF